MINHLEHQAEFEAVLAHYKPSEESIEVLRKVQFVPLMGLSGSGRNTIIRELVKTGYYEFVISDTTRLPRLNDGILEKDGVEYFFRTEDQMLEDLQEGELLEAAVIHDQQVSGVSIRALRDIAMKQKIAVADIQTNGIDAVLHYNPGNTIIFVLPPDFESWIVRLDTRGVMSTVEKQRRFKSALAELEHLKNTEYAVVVNDTLPRAVSLVREVIEQHRVLEYRGSKAERVVSNLEKGIQAALQVI